jgi:hypothetical protein
MMQDLPSRLRGEANATEELHPEDSEIEVMREAADEIERLWTKIYEVRQENEKLRTRIADFHNHELAEAIGHIEEAAETTRKKLRAHVREIMQTPHGEA